MTAATRPTGMALRDWADQIVLDLDNYGAFGRLDDEVRWQDWALQFFNNTTLGRNLPNPYQFTDWREWAERFIQMLA
jgi:hypothetical protein